MKFPPLARYLALFQPETRARWDPLTPLAVAGLGAFGVAFIYSAQLQTHGADWVKQLVFLALGAAIYTAVALIDYRFWLGVAHWCYLACLVPLVLVLTGLGHASGGSQRWISLGLFAFQPSETAKIGVLFITASLLVSAKLAGPGGAWRTLGKLALAAGVPILLILKQPDLKSAIVLPPMVFSMLFVSRLPTRFFLWALGGFVLVAGVVGWDTVRYKDFVVEHKTAGERRKFHDGVHAGN